METLFIPLEAATHTPATFTPTLPRPSRPAWWRRALQALWQGACQHAERPGRVVPYY